MCMLQKVEEFRIKSGGLMANRSRPSEELMTFCVRAHATLKINREIPTIFVKKREYYTIPGHVCVQTVHIFT